jgi:hypothetical protein
MQYEILTREQRIHFVEKGYVKLEGCFERADVQEWLDLSFLRLGYEPADPSTWKESRIHMPVMHRKKVAEFSPKGWSGICDVMGGSGRIEGEPSWGDGFIINFSHEADKPWQAPTAERGGWHKDGNFFRHFLDSPEQGLLTIILWDDILPKSGGTFLAADSVPAVARYLLDHPEGCEPGAFGGLISGCSEMIEATGKTGDVFLIHPFMLHSASPNPSGRPRYITNPPVGLKAPMNFNRSLPDDFSLVEEAVLHALGVDRLNFQISSERETYHTDFRKERDRMLVEEKARLVQLGIPVPD